MYKRDNSLIPFHRFFNTLADGVLNVFLPVLIFINTGDIWLTLIFMAVDFFVQAVFNLVLKKFILKHSVIALALHVLFIIASQAVVIFAGLSLSAVILAGIFAGVSSAFYYVPMYLNFAFSCKNVNSARLIAAESIGKAIILILTSYFLLSGFEGHFYLALAISGLLYIISIIPLVTYIKHIKRHFEAATKLTLWQYQKSFVRSTILQNLLGITHAIARYLVPIYLVMEHSIQMIGIVLAVAELSRILGAYIAKYLVHSKRYNAAMFISCVIWGAACIGLIFSKNSILNFVLSTSLLFSMSMIFVANFGIFTRRIAYEGGLLSGLVMREYHLNMSKLGMIGIFALSLSFPLVFSIGAIASFGIYFVPYRKRYSPSKMPYSIHDEIDDGLFQR